MDFIEYDVWKASLPIILWLSGGFLVGGLCFVMSHKLRSIALVITAFLVAILSMVMSIISSTAIERDHIAQAATQLNELYGTDLDSRDIYRLNYPRYAPKEDAVLGSLGDETLKDGKITSDRIYLVWDDGKIKLFQQVDSVSQEMPRVK